MQHEQRMVFFHVRAWIIRPIFVITNRNDQIGPKVLSPSSG